MQEAPGMGKRASWVLVTALVLFGLSEWMNTAWGA